MKGFLWVGRNAIEESLKDNISLLGAAISYYALFSLVPIVLILISLGAVVFDGEIIRQTILFYFDMYLGAEAAGFFDLVIDSFGMLGENWWAITGAVLVVLYAGTNVFTALHESFLAVYDFETEVKSPWLIFLVKRALGILSLVFILLVLFFLNNLNAVLDLFGNVVRTSVGGESAQTILLIQSTVVSFFVVWGLFTVVYKLYSQGSIGWKSSFIGAFIGSLAFIAITTAMKLYFGKVNTSLFFVLAGSVLVALLWVYYVSQGFLFGAEVAKAHDRWLRLGKQE